MLCNEGFLIDAKSAASSIGMPAVRILPETIPCECTLIEEIEAKVNAKLDDIFMALIEPLTEEERSPKPKVVERPSRIVFKGNLGEINQFFYKRGWTDGLPIIPPTEEAVADMLTGTDLPADHIVAEIVPRLGKATVEKIAINAVMAGALPTYMPVLIAGVQALMDPESEFGGWGVSTGSWAPFWIINGPIRNDLHVNSGSGALSPGDIANATIGRAMGLIIKNLGGARKGIEDMGVMGNPGKYTMVIAENEEANPWEPFHVEQGFNKKDSTITVLCPNSYWQLMPYGTDDKGILRAVVYNLLPGRSSGGVICLMLIPPHAKLLADNGWTKKGIAAFIAEHGRAPLYRFPQYYGNLLAWGEPGERGLLMSSEDSISILGKPDSIRVIVAGGAGNQMGLLLGSPGLKKPVTKKVDLPANWGKLVEKYKNITPTYIIY